tara:strand:+ start:6280 stop:6573 length:294 start_codon:yes stop_codon:yes gene_type:complete
MNSPGKFNFVKDVYTKKVFEETFQIISNIDGGWEFLKTFEPHKNKGFMFSDHPILSNISRAVEKCNHGHSGASWGMTMRTMECIAKNGWDDYVTNCL